MSSPAPFQIFSRRHKASSAGRSRSRRRGRYGRHGVPQHEQLEARRLMAIDIFSQPASGSVASGWVTVIANNGDDVYAQRAATKDGALLVANNASFLNRISIPNIDTYADVFVTNAGRVDVLDQEADQYPLLPFPALVGSPSNQTSFVLDDPFWDIDNNDSYVDVTISNGVGGQWKFRGPPNFNLTYEFFDETSPNFVELIDMLPSGDKSKGPVPLRARLRGVDSSSLAADSSMFEVEWNSSVIGLTIGGFDPESPPVLDISYDLESTGAELYESHTILASSASSPKFTLPGGLGNAFGEIVAGTLAGVFSVDLGDSTTQRFQFTTATRDPLPDSADGSIPLVFRSLDGSGRPVGTFLDYADVRAQLNNDGLRRVIQGELNPQTGVISLRVEKWFGEYDTVGGRRVPEGFGEREIGPITIESASFARFEQPSGPSDFTLFPGQNFVPSLTVDLLAPGSTISIESPIVAAPFVDLRGTTVVFDARVSSKTSLSVSESQFGVPVDTVVSPFVPFGVLAGGKVLTFSSLPPSMATWVEELTASTQVLLQPTDGADPGRSILRRVVSVATSGTDTLVTLNAPIDSTATEGQLFYVTDEAGDGRVARTVAERTFFNAAAAAKAFDIRLEDAIQTAAIKRSTLFVSATGSLAGELPVTGSASETPFDTLFAQVNTGDILIEGTVNGAQQSYIMQSPQEGAGGINHRGPYYFSTRSLVSGGNTGLLKGGTAAITLGNDVPSFYDETQDGGASAFNVLTLQTELTNLRVQASDQRGNPLQTPFPYDMDIREKDKINVDAVAASSLPILIDAGGDIDFRASLASASDVSVSSGGLLELNAPLSSAFGSIALTGKSLTVSNSCRVLDGFSDDLRTDILLTATAGSMKLVGPVSAVNTIELSQTDFTSGANGGRIEGPARVIADTLSFRSTGSVSLGTDVRLIKGQAERDVSFTEVDTVYSDITAYGNVSLVANGSDVEMLSDAFAAHPDRNDSVSVPVVVKTATTFALPANFAGLPSLFVGMGLQSSGVTVAAGETAASIASLSLPDAFGVVTVTIADGTIAGAAGDAINVVFGTFASFESGIDVIAAPVGASIPQLSVGQRVVSDLLPEGTRIVAIDAVTGELKLSAAATASGVAAIRFMAAVALWGEVREAASLHVSAPKGSIDIYTPTSDKVVLGNKTNLAAGTAATMQAAGTVTIRSLGGSIDVLDAPVAGLSAAPVRVVATENVGAAPVYEAKTPGTFPGTLTNNVTGALVIDGVAVRDRDRVLLAGQSSGLQNGAYQVVSPGSATTPWKLARLANFDTTVEMAVNSRFRVAEGANTGRIFMVTGYGNDLGTTPVAVDAVPNRYGAFPVKAVSTVTLSGVVYDSANGTIESSSPAALPINSFDEVSLAKDDLVLVRLGFADPAIPNGKPNTAANGVYVVSDIGAGGSNWKLTRVANDVFDLSAGGVVVVNEGLLRSRVTGNGYRVAYDGLGVEGMTVADVSNLVTTEIGSDNFNAVVTYVVSTNGGANTAAGSLGKMLLLAQQNIAVDPVETVSWQKSSFRFGNTVSTIPLTQQLPEITRTLTLDGGLPRYQVGTGSGGTIGIDGSRITRLRNGRTPTSTDQIHGLELKGVAASGSKIASLTMYGFARGAAVRLAANGQTLDGVVVDKMRLGTDPIGRSVANSVGILASGSVGGFTTISGNTVVASTSAGIRLANGAGTDGVRIVGNTVGRPGAENAIGIDVNAGATRQNRIGLEAPGGSVSRVTVTRNSGTRIELPKTFTGWSSLYVGMGVGSAGITGVALPAASAVIKSIDQANRLVEIEGGTIAANRATMVVDFGLYARFTVGEKVISVPQGLISIDRLYLGQPVASTALPNSTVITGIDRVNNTITLSNAALRTTAAAITLTEGGRNTVASNIRGINHSNGATQVVATNVFNSVFDGITVNGGTPRIGAVGAIGAGGRSTAKDITANSNSIYGNGGAGILVARGVSEAGVTIQGNVLGSDLSGRTLQANRRGNILFDGLLASTQPALTATFTKSGSTVTVTMPGSSKHGLPTGRKIYVAASTPVSGSVPVGAYEITWISETQFSVQVPSSVTAASGTLTFEKYGPLASLSLTRNLDFEGNRHGLAVQSPTGSSGGGGSGVVPPTGGRPVTPPPRRP